MATNWIATLKEQCQLVHRLVRAVPNALAHPDLTIDQASQIHDLIEKRAQDFDRIIDDMNKQILDDPLYVAADRLRDLWAELSATAADKVRTMQDLDSIEFAERHEG